MSSRTIYALTAGQKPVVITNHFYMRPDIKESLCTQFFFWCILDEKEGPILVDQSFTQRCLDEMKIPYQVKEGPLSCSTVSMSVPRTCAMSSCRTCTGTTTQATSSIPMPAIMYTRRNWNM